MLWVFGFFYRNSNVSRRTSELNVNLTQLREYIDHRATVKRINSEKWACLLVSHKYKLTSRISQYPDIGKMPKCFFDMCILNSVNPWGKTKFLFSTPGSHSCAYLPYEKCIHLPTLWERENIVLLYCTGEHFKITLSAFCGI